MSAEPSAIDALLARARLVLDRVEPQQLTDEMTSGALMVDMRPADQRHRDGELPGAIVIDRNVLEWRLDPSLTAPPCRHGSRRRHPGDPRL